MKISFGVGVIIASLLFPMVGAPGAQGIQEDMAALDRAYIPPLFITGQGKVAESQAAMKYLREGWINFKAKHYAARPQDPNWTADLDKVEDYIKTADTMIADGKDLAKAHEELEGVRQVMLSARRRNRIDYFPDHLTEFHDYMEVIFAAADKKTSETLGATDLLTIKETLPKALQVWQGIRQATFTPQLFGFGAEKVERLWKLHAAEESLLLGLQEGIAKNDKPMIIKNATALKRGFVPVFLLFGDFDRLKK